MTNQSFKAAGADRKDLNGPGSSTGSSCLLTTLLGGSGGASIVMASMLALESWIESIRPPGPKLSYGQMAGIVITPLGFAMGCGIGFALWLMWYRLSIAAAAVLIATFFLAWEATSSMWRDQIVENGRDPSEAVLYYPPAALCVAALFLALFGLTMSVVRWFREKRQTAAA